jgi:hypothetical protein
MTKTEMRQLFPFALDSIFLIDGQVYELLDRVDYWDYKNQRESFKYKIKENPLNTKCVNLTMRVLGSRYHMRD